MYLGFSSMNTADDPAPDLLARTLEEAGFESLWYGEHSHIPVSRLTPYPAGGELPEPVATGLAGTLDRATERLENGGRDAELAAELEALAARLENGAAGVANKRQAGLGQALAAIAQRLR